MSPTRAVTTHDGPRRDWLVRDGLWVAIAALVLRVGVVIWAAGRFPPAGDGQFYDVVAGRIARGLGYTWLWPDGAVTYAAHYPIGYPALVGMLYLLLGHHTWLAMVLNAVAGSASVLATHRIVSTRASRGASLTVALIAAVHPTLLAYTPAMMTEVVTGACLALAACAALGLWPKGSRSRWLRLVLVGAILGVATLIRPEQLVFAPFLGWIAMSERHRTGGAGEPSSDPTRPEPTRRWPSLGPGLAGAAGTLLLVVCFCLPWTIRNCHRMDRCAFISANAGWNLLIGTSPSGHGGWVPVDQIGVPGACRTVFSEVAKDDCFLRAAYRRISLHPSSWLKLIPGKLDRTFGDVGAPGWYLGASNGTIFTARARLWLAGAEVIFQRALLLMVAVAMALKPGPRYRVRRVLALIAAVCFCSTIAWMGVLLLVIGAVVLGRRLLEDPPFLMAAFGLGAAALIHGVFFGGARYAMPLLPLLIAAAAVPTSWWPGLRAGRL